MEIRRLFDCIYYQLEKFPLKESFTYKSGNEWKSFSTQEIVDKANAMSRGLLKLGVQPGDKIGVITYQNRGEWIIMDTAISQIGAINVPVYPTISPAEYVYIFNDAEIKYAVVGKDDLVAKVQKAQPDIPSLKGIYSFEHDKGVPHWETLMEADETLQPKVEELKAAVDPMALATLIYTSGTTGNPKGVMLSHNNIISNTDGVKELLPVSAGDKVLSFLPICHIFERVATYSYIRNGVKIYQTGTDNLGGEDGDLRTVAPHLFSTVPRLLEKVYEKIYNKGLLLTGAKKKLFFWALSLTDDYDVQKPNKGLKYTIADKLIFSKWREALGGNIKGILTGAAACPVKMMRVFSAAGIPIREGYGLTESSPGIAVSYWKEGGAMMGTVGPALPNVEIEIEEDDNYGPGEGEILAAGPNIMMGYYNKPEATADTLFEKDGKTWLRTGDIGKFLTDSKGRKFLKITDRKKELLKTSGGKYVAPTPIENKLKENFMVEQVMVVGEKQKFVSAIITPAQEVLEDWCKSNGVDCSNMASACKDPKVMAVYQKAVDELNPNFSHIEQIKKFVLIPDAWEPTKSDGTDAELTPTMKLKRRVIRKKYADQIAEIYNV